MQIILRSFAVIILFASLLPPLTAARGAGPNCDAAVEGTILYNSTHKLVQFCNGDQWIGLTAKIGETGDTLGDLTCASGEVPKWDGTVWACAADATGSAGLPALTSANIWVGNGSNAATAVALSGDATLSNAGALQLVADAVGNAELADDAVGLAELSATGTPSVTTYLRGDNTWATVASGADNLGDHIATQPIVSDTHNTDDLGTTAVRWKDGWFAGDVTAATFAGSGASLTALNATNLASGTVATARLGSGTADTTTYLRGDNTWATPTFSLPTLTSANIWIGNGSNAATAVAMSGDATISNTGVIALGADSVTSSEIAADAVSTSELADGAVTIPKLAATGTASGTTYLRGDNTWAAGDNLGSHTATLDLNMATKKIVSLAEPTATADAATKAYVDNAVGSPIAEPPAGCPNPGDVCAGVGKYVVSSGIFNYYMNAAYGANSNASAVTTCDAATTYSQTDWYLPSADELEAIYPNRVALGLAATYWASDVSDEDAGTYIVMNYSTGDVGESASPSVYFCMRKQIAGTTTSAKIWDDSTAGRIHHTGGRVGIMTTAPAHTLDVKGSIRATSTSYFDSVLKLGNDIHIYDKTGPAVIQLAPKDSTTYSGVRLTTTHEHTSRNWWNLVAYGAGYPTVSVRSDLQLVYSDYTNSVPVNKSAMYFAHSGSNVYVGIGDTSPTYRLSLPDVADSSGRGVADSWVAYSDGRFKTDVTPITDALDKIEQIEGVTYRSTQGDHPEANEREVGFIAQDVRKVLPEAVFVNEGKVNIDGQDKVIADYHTLAYDRITALLVQAMKELKAENDDLRKRLDVIEGQEAGGGIR